MSGNKKYIKILNFKISNKTINYHIRYYSIYYIDILTNKAKNVIIVTLNVKEIKMEINKIKSIIEAILFAAGREVTKKELIIALEISEDEIENAIISMQEEYINNDRGIELIKINDSYQLCSKKELHEYIYTVIDKRAKPNLSNASLETLSIIAYNPKITRAEIEVIRGVSADASVYRLLEYGLIEEAGKIDLPGKPMSYKVTQEFFKMFGYSSEKELPELPKYKMDENRQIVIDDLMVEDKQPEREEKTENNQE